MQLNLNLSVVLYIHVKRLKKTLKTFKSQKPQQNALPSAGEPITYLRPVQVFFYFPGLECFEFSSVISHGWLGNRNEHPVCKNTHAIYPQMFSSGTGGQTVQWTRLENGCHKGGGSHEYFNYLR